MDDRLAGQLIERIDNVGEDVKEIKSTVNKMRDEARKVEKHCSERHIRTEGLVEGHEERIKENTRAIKALQDSVQPLVMMSKVLGFVATLLAASVIGLIWMIITHQVQIVFP